MFIVSLLKSHIVSSGIKLLHLNNRDAVVESHVDEVGSQESSTHNILSQGNSQRVDESEVAIKCEDSYCTVIPFI